MNVRLEQEKLCLLVMIGVRADGRKELVALTDGYRESTESWADLLRDCKQRCWFHKMANVLAALPKSAHPAIVAGLRPTHPRHPRGRSSSTRRPSRTSLGAWPSPMRPPGRAWLDIQPTIRRSRSSH